LHVETKHLRLEFKKILLPGSVCMLLAARRQRNDVGLAASQSQIATWWLQWLLVHAKLECNRQAAVSISLVSGGHSYANCSSVVASRMQNQPIYFFCMQLAATLEQLQFVCDWPPHHKDI
jgi:hypothetical protein